MFVFVCLCDTSRFFFFFQTNRLFLSNEERRYKLMQQDRLLALGTKFLCPLSKTVYAKSFSIFTKIDNGCCCSVRLHLAKREPSWERQFCLCYLSPWTMGCRRKQLCLKRTLYELLPEQYLVHCRRRGKGGGWDASHVMQRGRVYAIGSAQPSREIGRFDM